MLEKIFKDTIEKYKMLEKNDKIILAISGGPDSIFMLYQFYHIQKEYKLKLFCAHFNHALRKEADEDEKFVKDLSSDLGIKFISEKKEVSKFIKNDSIEQVARNLRFDFLLKCSRELKVKKIALAHHKDDVVETTIMRFIRGSGLKGLQGILPVVKFKGAFFIRPLINMRKSQILDWLEKNNISYKIDKTNFEDKFFRNKIRLKLIPILEELNPSIVETIFNTSRLISLDYEFIYNFSKEKYNQIKKQYGKNYIKLNIEGLKKNSLSIILNILRIAIEELKGNTRKLDLRHFDEIIDLIYNRPDFSIVDLPDLEVKKENSWLVIKTLLF